MPKFEQITPILRVRDVEASIAYYTERLGFTDRWQFGEPPSFGGASRDGLEVQFCRDCQGSPGTWLSIWVDDVDALHAELAGRGADIVQAPTNFEWGVRELNVRDPDGHRIRFGWAPTGRATASRSRTRGSGADPACRVQLSRKGRMKS